MNVCALPRKSQSIPIPHNPAADEIHARAADKICDKQIRGLRVDFRGRTRLPDLPAFHDHHAIRQAHRLFLVVRDVKRGCGKGQLLPAYKFTQFQPMLCVQRAQRFIHQIHIRRAYHRPRKGNALLIPTRKLPGILPEQPLNPQRPRNAINCRADVRSRHADVLQRKRDVFLHAHVRVKRVKLKHKSHVALG